ncbi:enoyl-CoA hydratase/isomerase family protein [Gordonia sp. ABSL11-1]|uniref:enoyl-CoA hydratase/isomerase family protein n=1 Tax=Gordonia sp. ABSL11-1 TaxID=3053924 RepID=UPI002573A6DE|nr:enoyl-CoA hydratase/isomerase family protein [Gordonia sp. ABSL11-1]MDL9948598.1 enoyl-CoA hydratase/isomerase family protein [Gordonia sp. ABSL11-1]
MSENDQSVVRVTADGPIRTITLSRPEQLNAADADMHRQLGLVWRGIADDPGARAVIVTGAGRAFSAGGDFDFMEEHRDASARWRIIEEARRILIEMVQFPLPVVAAVNGPAVGLGSTLAMLCDIVVMSEDAFLSDPHVTIGLVAGDGGAATAPAHMSLLHAKEYLLLGGRVDARRAYEIGLANRVVEASAVMSEARSIAERLAAQPAHALQDTKRALNQSLELALASTRNYGLVAERYSMTHPDHLAFLDRNAHHGSSEGA